MVMRMRSLIFGVPIVLLFVVGFDILSKTNGSVTEVA
jgi:hypothetical protein